MSAQWAPLRTAIWTQHATARWAARQWGDVEGTEAWACARYIGRWGIYYGFQFKTRVFLAVVRGFPEAQWIIVSVWSEAWWTARVHKWQRQEERQWKGEA